MQQVVSLVCHGAGFGFKLGFSQDLEGFVFRRWGKHINHIVYLWRPCHRQVRSRLKRSDNEVQMGRGR